MRFSSDVMPRIWNHIQSITINLRHLPYLRVISQEVHHENLSKLTHLKIITGRLYNNTGTSYTTSKLYSIVISELRSRSLITERKKEFLIMIDDD